MTEMPSTRDDFTIGKITQMAAQMLTWSMLCGNQDGVNTLWDHSSIDLLVLNRDLSLAVRPQPANSAVFPDLCQLVPNLGGQHVCQRHQLGGLICGIAKHVTLVASTCIENMVLKTRQETDASELQLTYNNFVHPCQVQTTALAQRHFI